MKKILSLIGIFIFGISILAALGIYIHNNLPITIECLNCHNDMSISSTSTILFEFSRAVQSEMLEQALEINPGISSSWEWIDDQHVRWSSDSVLLPNQTYTLIFNPVEAGIKGAKIRRNSTWSFKVRPAKILVMQTAGQNGQEIFTADLEEPDGLTQLTFTNGNLHDYISSPDGETILFSVNNELNGRDLWTINRDGADMHKILDCQSDQCSSAAYSPDGQEIVFIRENLNTEPDNKSMPSVWIMNLASSQTEPLLKDSQISCSSPSWSPNGVWISFWSCHSNLIYLVNHVTKEVLTLESSQGDPGCWSVDGNKLYYQEIAFEQAAFYDVIQRADLDQGTIEIFLDWDNESGFSSYGNPVCNPVEDIMAVSVQPNIKIPGKKIAVIDLETQQLTSVKNDLTKIPGFVSWSPTGSQLLFQLSTLEQKSTNTIWVWDKSNQELKLVIENASAPSWLP